MNHSVPFGIRQFAEKAFAVRKDEIIREFGAKERQASSQARATGNIGAFRLALVACASDRLKAELLALAEAYVEAFTLHELPSIWSASKALKLEAKHITGGTISRIQGQLQSIEQRANEPGKLSHRWHLEIERTSACGRKARLNLRDNDSNLKPNKIRFRLTRDLVSESLQQ